MAMIGSARHTSTTGARGKHSHVLSGRKKMPHEAHVDPQQTTLTQINFVTRVPPPDVELDIIATTSSPPKKRRRFSPIRRLSSGRPQHRQKESSDTIQADSKQVAHDQPSSEKQLDTVSTRTDLMKLSLSQSGNELLNMQLPKTPSKGQRTIVPSSQSPEATPLSIRTNKGSQARQAASAQIAASARKTPSKTPRYQPQYQDVGEGQYTNELAEGMTITGDEEGESFQVSPLHLSQSQNIRVSQRLRSKDLQTSPDAPYTGSVRRSAAKRPVMGPPPPKNRTEVPSSQATTIVPTQLSSPIPSCSYPAPASVRVPVPSSQMTTQDPTQFSDPQDLPMPIQSRGKPTSGARTMVKEESVASIKDEIDHPDVRSSQAETVLPSSMLSENASWVVKPTTTSDRSRDRDLAEPSARPDAPGGANQNWQWDGKILTKSQLLPESLFNWEIPLPSSPSSQGSLKSIRSEDDLTEVKTESEPSSPRRSIKREPMEDNGDHSSEDDLQILHVRCKNPHLRGKQGARIKDEPDD